MSSSFFVYLLTATNGNTYVGATVDLQRRLRQHNKELVGGAHATGIKVSQGESWTRAAHVSGFPDCRPLYNLNGVGSIYHVNILLK